MKQSIDANTKGTRTLGFSDKGFKVTTTLKERKTHLGGDETIGHLGRQSIERGYSNVRTNN